MVEGLCEYRSIVDENKASEEMDNRGWVGFYRHGPRPVIGMPYYLIEALDQDCLEIRMFTPTQTYRYLRPIDYEINSPINENMRHAIE